MTRDKNVEARFTDRPVLVIDKRGTGSGTVISNPAGINCGIDCIEDYVFGDNFISLQTRPSEGSIFTGWFGFQAKECSGNSDGKINVNSFHYCIAQFDNAPTNFTLTVSKNGTGSGAVFTANDGIDCGEDCTENYATNAQVPLIPLPDKSSVFRDWNGACSGTGACTVSMYADQNITATFAIATPTSFIVSNLDDSGAGSLRQAVLDANANPGDDIILFQTGLSGTITLNSEQLTITDSVVIDGPGANLLAISGNNASRIFEINPRSLERTFAINGLTLKEGNDVSGSGGGAIYIDSGTVTINNCSLSNNSAINENGAGGGGIRNYGWLTISNSTLSNNTASPDANGGAIRNSRKLNVPGALTIINSTISSNSAQLGGGILIDDGIVTVSNSTVTGNSSSPDFGSGGGIFFNGDDGELRLSNSIVAGNTAANDKEIANGVFISQGHNLFGENGASGVATGITLADNDLILAGAISTAIGPLADNGGQTQTHLTVDGGPANDTGDNNLILQGVTTDQRGIDFPRIMNGTVDIGAVERIIKHTLSVSQTGGSGTITSYPGGIDCVDSCSASFISGSSVILSATPASGFRFTGWSGACTGTGSCIVSMTSADSVTAIFVALPVITVTASDNTASEVGLTTGTFRFARTGSKTTALTITYTVTGTASSGSDYVDLESSVTIPAGASTVTKTVTPLQDTLLEKDETILLTLTQIPDYTLGLPDSTTVILKNGNALVVDKSGEGKVSSSPAGINCGANCNQSYTNGTSVTLTATPDPGYVFTGWGGACSGSATNCTLAMDSAKNVTASFIQLHRSSWKRALVH